MNDSQFCSYMISQWAIAVGTILGPILLAAIAIWGHKIKMWLHGPKLQVALKSQKGESFPWGDGVKSWYYHLRVWNERRLSPAKNVRVVVKELWKKGAEGTMIPITLSGPFQLAWQFQGSNPQWGYALHSSIYHILCVLCWNSTRGDSATWQWVHCNGLLEEPVE